MKIDEALHLLVESFDLDAYLGVKIWDSALLDQFDDVDVTLDARLEVGDLILQLLLFYFGQIGLL